MKLHEGDRGRLYTGEYDGDGPLRYHVLVTDGNGQRSLPAMSHDWPEHDWGGDGGSGRQLAHDLLFDVTGIEPPTRMVEEFREQVLVWLDGRRSWQLTEAEVEGWIEGRQR